MVPTGAPIYDALITELGDVPTDTRRAADDVRRVATRLLAPGERAGTEDSVEA